VARRLVKGDPFEASTREYREAEAGQAQGGPPNDITGRYKPSGAVDLRLLDHDGPQCIREKAEKVSNNITIFWQVP